MMMNEEDGERQRDIIDFEAKTCEETSEDSYNLICCYLFSFVLRLRVIIRFDRRLLWRVASTCSPLLLTFCKIL